MSAPETVTWTLGSLLGFFGVIGVLVRTWLLPYLREQVVTPIRETHHQVTVNGGKSSPPTMLDKLTAVSGDVSEVKATVAKLNSAFAAHMRDHHGAA